MLLPQLWMLGVRVKGHLITEKNFRQNCTCALKKKFISLEKLLWAELKWSWNKDCMKVTGKLQGKISLQAHSGPSVCKVMPWKGLGHWRLMLAALGNAGWHPEENRSLCHQLSLPESIGADFERIVLISEVYGATHCHFAGNWIATYIMLMPLYHQNFCT